MNPSFIQVVDLIQLLSLGVHGLEAFFFFFTNSKIQVDRVGYPNRVYNRAKLGLVVGLCFFSFISPKH